MTDLRLYTKISSLPDSLKSEVIDFVDFISSRNKRTVGKEIKKRTFGYAKGTIVLKPDFDEPLDDFREYMQ